MTAHDSKPRDPSLPTGSLVVACAILLTAMKVTLGAVGGWAYAAYGPNGLAAATLSWLLCSMSALTALVVSARFASAPYAMWANLATMLIRMGVPLVGLLVLPRLFPVLTAAGLGPCLLVCYLVALVVETVLVIRILAASSVAHRVSTSKVTVGT